MRLEDLPDDDEFSEPAAPAPLATIRAAVDRGEANDPFPEWMDGCPIEQSGRPKRSHLALVHVLSQHPDLREALGWCERRQVIEVLRDLPWSAAGKPVEDVWFSQARSWLEASVKQQWSKDAVVEATIQVAHLKARDKVQDYLRGLTWDHVERISRFLIEEGGADDLPVVEAMTRAFFVGAAKRALEPGCKHDCALVLEGHQEMHKSQLVRALGGEWTDDNMSHFEGVEAQQHVAQGPWLIELAEFSVGSRSRAERIKQFLSLSHDRFRAPYARTLVTYPRRCAFVISTNEFSGYIDDPTGARRFWPVRIRQRLHIERIKGMRDQLWAEAVWAANRGEAHWLEGSMRDAAREHQELRINQHPWHDRLADWVRDRERFSMAEVYGHLEVPPERWSNANAATITKVLQALGCENGRSRHQRWWRWVG
jgi:predicted P-loop ATPase